MKMWSYMFAVNDQCVSVQQVNWSLVSLYIQTSEPRKALARFYATKVSGIMEHSEGFWQMFFDAAFSTVRHYTTYDIITLVLTLTGLLDWVK